MKNKGLIYTLAIIIIAGMAITMSTDFYLDQSRQKTTVSVSTMADAQDSPAEAAVLAGGGTAVLTAENPGPGDSGQVPAYEGTAENEAASEAGRMARTEAEGIDAAAASAGPGAEAAAASAGPAGPGADAAAASTGPGAEAAAASAGPGTETAMASAEAAGPGAEAAEVSADYDKSEAAAKADSSADSVSISPLETTTAKAQSGDSGTNSEAKADVSEEASYYLKRLNELDAQIQKNRESQSASNSYSAKNAASNELKLWDNELNVIYGVIMEQLDEKRASELVLEERGWMKERDRLATEAAKASAGGSMESVEYTVSLAESTRKRAYELVEVYGYLLND